MLLFSYASKHMKTSTKLLLTGAVIISLSLIVFGTDALLSLLTFYQNFESPSTSEMAEGISDSIGSALIGVAGGFLGVCVFISGFISIFFEKRNPIVGDASRRRRFTEY